MYLKILCRLQKSHNIVSVRLARLLFLKYNTDHLFPKFPIFWGGGPQIPDFALKIQPKVYFPLPPFIHTLLFPKAVFLGTQLTTEVDAP